MKSAIKKTELSFEDALNELEDITARLEQGKDSLETSMQLYEKGVFLKDFCQEKLKEAEGKWKVLRKKKNGEVVSEEIDSSSVPAPGDLNHLQESMFGDE